MPENSTTPPAAKPAAAAVSIKANNMPVKVGLLSVVAGLLLPPAGLILAVIAIYKGGQKAKNLAMILGVVGLISSIAGGVLYTLAYNDRQKASVNTSYTYTSYDNVKIAGNLTKDGGMAFVKPEAFISQESVRSPLEASFIQLETLANYSNRTAVGSIDAATAIPANELSGEYLADFNRMLKGGNKKSAAYKNFNAALLNFLTSRVTPGAAVTIDNTREFSSENIKKNAWLFDYTAQSTWPDGSPRVYKGTLLYAIGEQTYYYLSVASTPSNWAANSNTWQRIFDSAKIDQ